MNKRLSSNRNMFQLILNLLVLFDGLWSVIPSVASIVNSFRLKNGEIDETAAEQQASLIMYKKNKTKKKRDLADRALVIRGKISSFAAVAGDLILLGKMKISFSKLFYTKDTTAVGYAEIIYDAASAMTTAQRTANNISDDDMTAFRNAIDTYKALPSPVEMRVIRKQQTASLNELFEDGNAILKDSLDGLMHQWKDSNSDFFNQYFNARFLLESHRHTLVQGFAVDETSGEDLSQVKVLITSPNQILEETTDVQGFYKQQISPETEYNVKFILPDYESQEFEKIKLSRGKHLKLDVKLKKKEV